MRPKATLDGVGGARRAPASPSSITTALALTWLNPHVYLDTVVLLGSIASTHGDEPLVVRRGRRASRASRGSPPSGSEPVCWHRCSPARSRGASWTALIAVVMLAHRGLAGRRRVLACEHRVDLGAGRHRGRGARAGDRDGCRDRRRGRARLPAAHPRRATRPAPRRTCRRRAVVSTALDLARRAPRCTTAPSRATSAPREPRVMTTSPTLRLSAIAASVSSSTPASSHASCALGIRMSTSLQQLVRRPAAPAPASARSVMPRPRATTNASVISSIGRSNWATR